MSWSENDLLAGYRRARGPTRAQARRIEAALRSDPSPRLRPSHRAPTPRVGMYAAMGIAAAVAAVTVCSVRLVVEGPRRPAPNPSMALDEQQESDSGSPVVDARTRGATKVEAPPTPRPGVPEAPPLTPAGSVRHHEPGDDDRSASPSASPNEASSHETTSTRSNLHEELRHIHRARAALAADQPQLAQQAIETYRHRFPFGTLREEAEAVDHLARCRLHPHEALSIASAFGQRYPSSLFRSSVTAACEKSKAR